MATTKKPRARKGSTKRTKKPSRRAAVMAAAAPTAQAQAAMALSAAVAQKAEQESRDRDNDEILVNENIRRRALINRTLRERVAAHQAMVKAVRAATAAAAAPEAPQRLNILAQGDSWFDYPPSNADIIDQLPVMLNPNPMILNLAHHGEVTTTLLGVTRRERLLNELKDPNNGGFDAILFSGGGNDLAGDQFRLWLRDADAVQHDPMQAIDDNAFDAIMSVVLTGYRDLIAARNSVDRTIPIFVYAYDFAWPTNFDVCGVVGPWIYPSLHSRGWMSKPQEPDLSRGAGIVKAMLTAFEQRLGAALQNDNIVLVRTQGVLGLKQWANEMHPTREGFRWITRCFAKAIADKFPNRAATVGF